MFANWGGGGGGMTAKKANLFSEFFIRLAFWPFSTTIVFFHFLGFVFDVFRSCSYKIKY